MITAHHLVFGRKYAGVATFGNNSSAARLYYSTRAGNILVDWGDGTTDNYSTFKNTDFVSNPPTSGSGSAGHAYSSTQIRDIKLNIANGLSDVYSIALSEYYNVGTNWAYILNWGDYIKQFVNLYSLYIHLYSICTIKGDLSQIPNSLERIFIKDIKLQNNTDLYLNLSNFSNTSQLKYFSSSIALYDNYKSLKNIYGDLSKLPPLINYFLLSQNLANTLTYTAGRNWASSFDTLDIGNATLSATETDNLLNDMANSITTAIGSKIIRLANCYRTIASNTAVAYLQSLGFTITVGIGAKILDLPLQNNFTDTTGINTIIAGGTSNLPAFTLEGGEYGATFNGSQSLKTNANLNINSDKVSVSFWLKTSQTSLAMITELSVIAGSNNAFYADINETAIGVSSIEAGTGGTNAKSAPFTINNNTWHHVVLIIDRNLTQSISIYINGSLRALNTMYGLNANTSGNFGLFPLFIGQRAGSTLGFNGQLKFVKIFNYPLSTTEITNLYNKIM